MMHKLSEISATLLLIITISFFSCTDSQQVNTVTGETFKPIKWRMVTTWPPHFPVLGESADMMAQWIDSMSGGRLQIQVYGGGELVPPFEVFDAVSQGSVHMGHGAAYYWSGKIPASVCFAAVPFGLNAQQMNAWMLSGGGLELYSKCYDKYNLVPFIAGNTGVQMGGWFNKEINTVDDLKGLKMRMPGLGGQVIAKAGGSAVVVPGGELYTSLERGVIDATEWIGPYHDYLMGFHKIAKYYYYPGWHEPGTALELIVNKQAYESLPPDLQKIVETAAARSNVWMLSEFEAKNNEYLEKILAEGTELRKFPDDVLAKLKTLSDEVIAEQCEADAQLKEVYESMNAFKESSNNWKLVSEDAMGPYLK